MTLTPTDVFLYGVVLTGLGWIFGHRLALNRDTIARKAILDKESDIRRRNFLKFIHCFRGRMERVDHTDDAAVWKEYVRLAPEFKGEVALVGGDFSDHPTFHSLTDTVGGWPRDQAEQRAKKETKNLRQIICDSIDRLIEFTEKHAEQSEGANPSPPCG